MSLKEEKEHLVSPAEERTTLYTDDLPGTSKDVDSTPYSATNVENTNGLKVYKRRWYILGIFVAMNITYNFYWNAFGPIQGPLKHIYGFEDWQILLLQSWAAVSLIAASFPMGWIIETKGLRTAVAISSAFLLIGKGLQALPFFGQTADVIILNFGQIVALLAGPICLGAPSFVSAVWFPPTERTTATAIGTQSSYLGLALSYLLGPYFVSDLPSTSWNKTRVSNQTVKDETNEIEGQFKGYVYFQAALAMAVLVVILIYYPSRPKLPPSRSSAVKRHELLEGVKHLISDFSYLLLATMFSLQFGVVCIWLAILDVILSKFNIDQSTAGWLGCAATLAGTVSGVLISRIADSLKRKTKTLLVIVLIGGTISHTFFTLTCENILPFNKVILFLCIILTGFFMVSVIPLFFELVVECTYPASEAITTGLLMLLGNVVLLSFFIVFMFPNMDVRYINWVMVGTIAVCVFGVSLYKEKYTRLDLDTSSSSSDKHRN